MPDDYKLFVGDCKDVLRDLPDNSVDGCMTDPPYGMGMEEWDHSVPTQEIWEEVFRVLKPGGFCLSFCSPQLYHRMAIAVEDAGFLIKDQIMWMITTKMPKQNRLKPAHEPIVVAQKPFKGSIEENLWWRGVGKIDVETTRVPWDGEPPTGWIKGGSRRRKFGKEVLSAKREKNICDLVVNHIGKESLEKMTDSILDVYTKSSTYPEDLKIVINEALKTVKGDRTKLYFGFEDLLKNRTQDANTAGRYPSNIIGEVLPEHQKYFYAPRVTRKERGDYNDHPTPKPIALMSYLVKIYCPPNGIVLDPFCGSGSTGIGALLEGRKFCGIDLDEHYIEISKRRIQDHVLSTQPKHDTRVAQKKRRKQ